MTSTPTWTRTTDRLVAEFAKYLRPPAKLKLSEFAQEKLYLWDGPAQGERFRAWSYQTEIMDVMAEPGIERVSVIKPTRIGYTKGLVAAIAARAETAPCAMMVLVPTEDDARRMVVDEIDPCFRASRAMHGVMRQGRLDGRNTLLLRQIRGGGSLKVLPARSPRNLRSHDVKVLYQDEIDAMEITKEGDPLLLAERRTLAHADRKIISGSTPTIEGVSNIERLYEASDKRIFEVPCPSCSAFTEILWEHINWPQGEPEKAFFACPHNGCVVEERHKAAMVAAGRWKVTAPEVKRHAGFRINALVSLFANASWGQLAAEYMAAKRSGPAALMVFVNTVLGRTWRTSVDQATPSGLMERVEPFGLFGKAVVIPPEVVAITCGVDCQPDRFECGLIGWPVVGPPLVLGHHVIYGRTLEDVTWAELDTFLATTWAHPNGWRLGIDCTAIDSGGEPGLSPKVYAFCATRAVRRIFAIKGRGGSLLKKWQPARRAKGGAPLFIVATDPLKTEVTERLGQPLYSEGELNPQTLRLSHTLTDEWFEQATGEKRFVKYVGNRPVVEWKPKNKGQRVEALDCLVYAFAVAESNAFRAINRAQRANWSADAVEPAQAPARRVVRSGYMGR